jgi:hypothetical protein
MWQSRCDAVSLGTSGKEALLIIVGGLDRCSFRTRYHTQVPEISGKLNGKKPAFTWATLLQSPGAE